MDEVRRVSCWVQSYPEETMRDHGALQKPTCLEVVIPQIMEHVVTKASVAEAFTDRLRQHFGECLVKVLCVPRDPHDGSASPDIIYLIVIYDPELSEDERHAFFGVVTGFLLKEGGPYYVDAHPLSRADYQ